jgi:hypothetical protein
LPLFFLIVSVCGQLVQLFPNTGNAGNDTVPAARLLHSFDYDQNGAFLLFGGLGIGTSGWGYLSSLWRYDQESMSWSLIDGNGESDTQARSDSKPTPRGLHASWVDGASGNLLDVRFLHYPILSNVWMGNPPCLLASGQTGNIMWDNR